MKSSSRAMLCVAWGADALCVQCGAERRQQHSHVERGNEEGSERLQFK